MTFKEARKKVQKIADGKYFSVGYEVSQREDKIEDMACSVYISNAGYYSDETFEGAIRALEKAMDVERVLNHDQEPEE